MWQYNEDMNLKGMILFLFVANLSACASVKNVGPVTDSNYFNQKLSGLASSLTKNASRRPRRVAIMDFVNAGGKTSQLGRYVTDKFSSIVVSKRLFAVPSKGEVQKAIKDAKVKYDGTLNQESSSKLGKALKADAVVVGTISDLQKGSDIDLMLKMIDSKSGTVISAASTSFVRSKSVSSMFESF